MQGNFEAKDPRMMEYLRFVKQTMNQFLSRPKPNTWICDHDQHANIKLKPDINMNQLNFYKSFPPSFHYYFFT